MSTTNLPNLTARQINSIVLTVLGIFPLIGMGIDLIAPSLPAISHSLNTSSNIAKNLITLFLLGYAVGNFTIGFLSDAWGRRKFIIGGFLLFIIASLLPTIFINTATILFSRFLQGVAIAATAVASRAVLADVLTSTRLIRVATMIATMWAIGPILGPIIGGYLQYYFNWQACFYFFAAFGLVGLTATLFTIPETHINRHRLNIINIKNDFLTIIKDRTFVGLAGLMGLTYSLLIVFNTLGPFIIQTELKRTSVFFGHVALYMGLTFLLGTFLCRHLIKRFRLQKIFSFVILFFLSIAILGIILADSIGALNIWIIVIPSFFMFLCASILYPASMGKGLSLFRHLAGSCGAVMNLINVSITSLTAYLMSFIYAEDAIPMLAIYLGLLVLCYLVYWGLVRKTINS